MTQTTHRRLRSNTVKSRFALSVRRENLGPPPQQLAQSVSRSGAAEQIICIAPRRNIVAAGRVRYL